MPNSRPALVSIVTPSFNQGRYIERTVRSVLCQAYPAIEYLVMDGKSGDETATILDKYHASGMRLVCERDAGQADALHRGFSLVDGEILAWLNADDVYAGPNVVANAVAYFARHPEVDVLFGRRVVMDVDGRFRGLWPRIGFEAGMLRRVDFIPQECCFWRRSLWERAGGYVHRGYEFAMDYELWLRFMVVGARFAGVNQVFGLCSEHAAQKTQAGWDVTGWA
ncbi:MAG: glycosyltransferase family 2 protein [Candidatus Acidiferrum sp.]